MDRVFLTVAILAEVTATSALKATHGFTQLGPLLVVGAGYGVSFWCLSMALRSIPMGVAYAVWSGVGLVLITVAAWRLYGQRLDAAALAGMTLILAGVLVINLFSRSVVE